MRKALIYLVLSFLCAFNVSAGAQAVAVDTVGIPRDRWVHAEGEFLRHLQKRDSILIGDQMEYGFRMDGLEDGTVLGFPEISESSVELVRDWQTDVVGRRSQGEGKPDLLDVEATIRVAAFEEGLYKLPPIIVGRVTPSGKIDTLFFDPMEFEVKTMPLDTATFQPHPMKGLIQTPFNWDEFVYTVKELWAAFVALLPWLISVKWLLILIVAGFCLWLISERKGVSQKVVVREPAHIVALRKLDTYRSNALWVPERQKDFYTGVTDALREYISGRYGISAMEMTSGELFSQMKNMEEITPGQIAQIQDLFETADFVKFAKYVASDEDNATAVPKAVRFVTETYQTELENQPDKISEELEDKKK
jgi:hypothetical protein